MDTFNQIKVVFIIVIYHGPSSRISKFARSEQLSPTCLFSLMEKQSKYRRCVLPVNNTETITTFAAVFYR